MVHIVQLLCPVRHCLLSAAYEQGIGSFEESRKMLEDMIGPKGAFNARCEICGSVILHFEDAPTTFATLKEAMPSLMESQSKQMATRAVLESLGATWKPTRN